MKKAGRPKKKVSEQLKLIAIRLDQVLLKKCKECAKKEGKNLSEYLRDIIYKNH